MQKFSFIALCLVCIGVCINTVFAQTDTMQLHEVMVTSYKDDNLKQTSLNIVPLTVKQITQSGAYNLCDALAKVPGISQLSTGVAIAKPVIRGLYGNRILVMFSGLRFDNQQWQDEHGLGLSDIGISKTEIIKGPFSLLYGTEAVAGVINILEEEKAEEGNHESDFGIKLNSNTLGGTVQYGTKINYGNHWLRLRLGIESNADYTDGNKDRILNSRFDGYYAKVGFGFKKGNWLSDNNYNFSINRFGFIFSDIYDFFEEADGRWSRDFSGPHHIVILNIMSSQNTFYLPNSTIKLNAGFQSNQRKEDEGGGAISLDMQLITGEYTLRWIKSVSSKMDLILANITSVENNTNYGKRRIIPDAWMFETGVSAFLKYHIRNSVLELGGGFGGRYIKTLYTAGVNSDEKEIDPFQTYKPFGNFMAGVSLNPASQWNIKLNVATGVRSPNLAELSSNGLHEGTYSYEIGDPELKNETNLNGNVDLYYTNNVLQWSISGFYNHFNKYIYLSPTDEEWYGFPIYRYRQQSADLYGGEASLSTTPAFLHHGKVQITYAGMIGKTADRNYLPFIPAQKITPEIRYEFAEIKKLKNTYIFINTDIVFAQKNIAPEETTTEGYHLLNTGIGCVLNSNRTPIEINLIGNNLLNEVYYDHLSRFKPLELHDIGMNIVLNCKIKFSKTNKTKQK